MLLHQVVVAGAFLTYLLDREDVVWRFIKNTAASRVLEHALFAVATLLVGVAAVICTWTRAHTDRRVDGRDTEQSLSEGCHNWRYFGDFLYAIGLASLLPLAGFMTLVIGEAIRISRLMRGRDKVPSEGLAAFDQPVPAKSRWLEASRREAFKWGIFVAMVVFTITLRDRVADALIGIAYLLGLFLTTFRSGPFQVKSEI